MKILRLLGLLGAAVLAPVESRAVVVSLDFNGVDTFTPNFLTHSNGSSPSDVVWSDSSGIGGGGGLIAPTGGGFDRSAVYANQVFDLASGQKATISMFVKDGVLADGNSRPLQLGFINDPNLTFNGGNGQDFLSVRIRGDQTAQLQYAIDGNTFTDSAMAFSIAAGDWLKLTIEFQMTDMVAGTLTYSYVIDDYGATGTGTPIMVLNSGTKTVTNAQLISNVDLSNVYAGFRSNEVENPGFDNFTVNAVPEPGSLSLVILAGMAVIARHRRP